MLCAVGTTPGGRAGALSTAAGWLRTRSLKQLGTYLAGLGILVSAPFGGWADAEPESVTEGKAGDVVEAGPFEITIDRVTASTRPGLDFRASKDGQYLLVFGTVTSTVNKTLSDGELADAVRLVDVDGIERYPGGTVLAEPAEAVLSDPTPYVVDDSTVTHTVSPGITYDVAWVWHRHLADPPQSVRVQVNGFTSRMSTLQDTDGWRDPTAKTHLELPVKKTKAYTEPAESTP